MKIFLVLTHSVERAIPVMKKRLAAPASAAGIMANNIIKLLPPMGRRLVQA